jgi:hypothetical protein
MPDTAGIPTQPVDTEPTGFYARDAQADALRDTLTAAGVELGTYDMRIVNWLAGWEWGTLAVIASWVARAAQTRAPAPAIALPSRFDASPAEVDKHLRRILAEDVYLRYQQAIGGEAVTDAAKDMLSEADPSAPNAEGWRAAADYLRKDGGPYPSRLLCSQHGGFAPCPGAPRCTPQEDAKGGTA